MCCRGPSGAPHPQLPNFPLPPRCHHPPQAIAFPRGFSNGELLDRLDAALLGLQEAGAPRCRDWAAHAGRASRPSFIDGSRPHATPPACITLLCLYCRTACTAGTKDFIAYEQLGPQDAASVCGTQLSRRKARLAFSQVGGARDVLLAWRAAGGECWGVSNRGPHTPQIPSLQVVGLWYLLAIAVGVGFCLAAAPCAAAWLVSRRSERCARAALRRAGSRRDSRRASCDGELTWAGSQCELKDSCGAECGDDSVGKHHTADAAAADAAPAEEEEEPSLAALLEARHIATSAAARLEELLQHARAGDDAPALN